MSLAQARRGGAVPELAGIETVLFLQSIDLFRFCSAEQVLRLAAISHERRYQAGETVFEVDDPANELFCVVHGAIELDGGADSSEELGPLSTFGVTEILCGRLRTRGARATGETLVLAMAAEDLFDLLANNIEIVKAIFRRLLPEPTLPTASGERR